MDLTILRDARKFPDFPLRCGCQFIRATAAVYQIFHLYLAVPSSDSISSAMGKRGGIAERSRDIVLFPEETASGRTERYDPSRHSANRTLSEAVTT